MERAADSFDDILRAGGLPVVSVAPASGFTFRFCIFVLPFAKSRAIPVTLSWRAGCPPIPLLFDSHRILSDRRWCLILSHRPFEALNRLPKPFPKLRKFARAIHHENNGENE